jgi:hypothetical protein
MSTSPVKSLDDLVREQYEKLKAQAGGEDPAPTPTPSQIKMNIAGQERSFNSTEEASEFMNATLAAQQQAIAAAQAQVHQGTKVTADDQMKAPTRPKADINEFANRLRDDPAAAFDYVDEMRYGGNPVKIMQELYAKQQAQEQVLAAYQFRDDHPEFPRTPENAQALMQIVQAHNLPFTYDGLELAYSVARQRGLVKTEESGEESSPEPSRVPRRNIAPPRVGRGTGDGGGPDILDQVEDMSASDIAKIISRFESR